MNIKEGFKILYTANGGDEADLKELSSNNNQHVISTIYGDGLSTKLPKNVADNVEKMAKGGGDGSLPDVDTLDSMSWSDIKLVSQYGEGENYFSIGDTKQIELNGTVGTLSLSNTTLYVFILGFDHNTTYEEEGITFGTFKTSTNVDVCLIDSWYHQTYYPDDIPNGTKAFNINHWGSSSDPYNTNYGGWKGCDLRYDILGSTNVAPSGYGAIATTSRVGYDPSSYNIITNPVEDTLLSAFPQSLRVVMKPNTKYTDNTGNSSNTLENVTASIDYLWLLSEYEVSGRRNYANQYEQNYQAQYQYYIDGGSTIKCSHSSTEMPVDWWKRSPLYYSTRNVCYINSGGGDSSFNSKYSNGLSPAFLV